MKKWPWLTLSLIIILFDQATKYWALESLTPFEPVYVLPMFSFTLAFNTGAAFSFLSGAGVWHQWFFVGFSAVMSVVLLVWMLRADQSSKLLLFSISMILGGAIGNLIDRLTQGHVIDFIDLYYRQYHCPVFNLADSAICIGAVFIIIDLIKHPN
jgi:signal peptidase II